jgi:iron complex transport system substrate-binding protein
VAPATAANTPTEEVVDLPEPTEPEIEPTATKEAAPEPTEEPTPYPEPEKPAVAPTQDPYPGTEEDIVWPLVFTDDLGNTIELDAYPQAIVSLSPSTTEILFAVGAGDQVIGRDEFSLYPEAALEVENIGSLWESVPTEAILALEPDLVIAAQIVSEENIQVLQDLGLTVYWQADPADFDGLYENILTVAAITGHTEKAEALVADLQSRVDAVVDTVADAADAPSVFYELDATDPANPWTTGSGTFIDYIITMAGGVNAAAALEGDYAQISAEELIAVNPEVILLADALYGITPESVAGRPGWDVIIAVQTGSIYPIDPNIMSVPGPRLVDALEETARLLHPALFE